MPNTLPPNIWQVLLESIAADDCMPFLGAGACAGVLPLGGQIARQWADEYDYPLADRDNLIRVAQYLAVRYSPNWVKRRMLETIEAADPPDFDAADEPHALMADLPLSFYMTTNYDDFLVRALDKKDFRQPIRERCYWYDAGERGESVLDESFESHKGRPVVFHLHGHTLPASLVLTEDDYLRFLVTVSKDPDLIPAPLRRALGGSCCLFIGYSLSDWNFRVLFELLRKDLRQRNVAVLLPPGSSEVDEAQAQQYLDSYYKEQLELYVYWGTAREFAAELRQRLDEFGKKKNKLGVS